MPEPVISVPARYPSEFSVGKSTTSDEVRLIDYTDKAFVVIGDTSSYAQQLKDLSGKWITVRFGGKAWMFSKKRLNDVANLLELSPELQSDEDL
ncbi:hypothetical protein [Yersinia mollaretii]|uniref:hypothetical protein n=1 Tax=Yersinia mollaretii TaxID=33060 RepID=UPI001C943ACC|nr:hypothetical protein [Yersinia mollaretii]